MLTAPASACAGEVRDLGPVSVRVRRREAATAEITGALAKRQPLMVAFANTHLLYCALRDAELAQSLKRFYVLNDGVGLALIARLVAGRGFPENLNGTDFTPNLLAALPAGTRVLMVGTRKETVQRAAWRASQQWPHLAICGCRDGFEEANGALKELDALAPDIVLVGMGNPVQERWIVSAAQNYPRAVFIGVGAWFDFFAQAVPRAPEAWRNLRLEWAFRLTQEPQRLWRRYTVEVLVVIATLLAQRRRPI